MNKVYFFNVHNLLTILIKADILMLNRTSLNVAILLWGSMFCITACIVMIFNKNYDRRKRLWMILMQASTMVLMLSDVIAWLSECMSGVLGYWFARISNFTVFMMNIVILFFFHKYVCSCIFTVEEERKLVRARLMNVICAIAALLIIVSQFTNLYYYVDVENIYHRNPGYIVAVILPLTGMVIELSFLIQYRKKLSRSALIALSSYIILPVIAVIAQFAFYGASLIDISIGIAMMIIYITVLNEQNVKLDKLSKKQSETAAELNVSMVLNQCIAELTTGADINIAIHNILAIINNYFGSDRCFIYEKNLEQDILIKTYEYALTDYQNNTMKHIPMRIVTSWFKEFKEGRSIYISDVNDDVSECGDLLRTCKINRIIAVPLKRNEDIIGFFAVANPTVHFDDVTILSSIQYFITSNLEKKAQQEALYNLSYRDMLTHLYNRNKYINVVESSKGQRLRNTGVAYIDLNGLKKINDNNGHAQGDAFICTAANVLSDTFPDECYRVGGDEFVIVEKGIAKDAFDDKIKTMKENMKKRNVSISIGVLYEENVDDLEKLLKSADKLMYIEKERFHRENSGR